MPAKDLGNKFTCYKCSTKFYDLKKSEPICPKCGADQRESPALKSPAPQERRSRAPARAAVVEETAAEVVTEEAELDEDAEDPVEEDAEDAPEEDV